MKSPGVFRARQGATTRHGDTMARMSSNLSVRLGPFRFLAAAFAAATLGACAVDPRPEYYEDEEIVVPAVDPMDLGMSDYIRMERGPCFGACPEYVVVIGRDGLVRFRGEGKLAATGLRDKQISTGRVAGLRHAVARLGILQLESSYVPGDETCGDHATDMPTVKLQVVGPGGGVKRITHYLGCSEAPNVLKTFESLIDEAAGTQTWISPAAPADGDGR